MKAFLKRLGRSLGYDIRRIRPKEIKPVETGGLAYYATETGNYYLPSGADRDVIAQAIINNEIFLFAALRSK